MENIYTYAISHQGIVLCFTLFKGMTKHHTHALDSASILYVQCRVLFLFFFFFDGRFLCLNYSFNPRSHMLSIHYMTRSICTLEYLTQSSSEVSCCEQALDHLAIRPSQDELTSNGSDGCQLQSRTAR
jgi:hypothetical protein